MDAGLYIAIFHLDTSQTIRIGRLGKFDFPVGLWLYVGSAQRALRARLERHARRVKPLRWHIDYLAAHAHMLGAILIAGDRRMECRIAERLARVLERPIRRFGASDCRCGGHLFHTLALP